MEKIIDSIECIVIAILIKTKLISNKYKNILKCPRLYIFLLFKFYLYHILEKITISLFNK